MFLRRATKALEELNVTFLEANNAHLISRSFRRNVFWALKILTHFGHPRVHWGQSFRIIELVELHYYSSGSVSLQNVKEDFKNEVTLVDIRIPL